MTPLVIPTFADAFWTQTTNLDGVDYTLRFRYNQREACYYMSIGTPEGVSILEGIKIVTNWPLLAAYNDAGRPPGEFMALAQGADDSTAQLGELGDGLRVTLFYFAVTA